MAAEVADDCVFLSVPKRFGSVGEYYDRFQQVTDAEVTALLERARQS
jgi:predicted phosphoribosyltransferase